MHKRLQTTPSNTKLTANDNKRLATALEKNGYQLQEHGTLCILFHQKLGAELAIGYGENPTMYENKTLDHSLPYN